MTPLKAIREKCLDCVCDAAVEVRRCVCTDCPLFPFRFGRNPNRAGIGGHNGQFAGKPYSTNDFEREGAGI